MEAGYLGVESREGLRPVRAAGEEGARVPQDARHVADELVGSAHFVAGAERSEGRWGAAQSLLGAVGERRQEVAEQVRFVFAAVGHRGEV